MVDFRSTLDFCELNDMGFVGPKFTWCNMRGDGQFIKERLERVVANGEWEEMYPVRNIEVIATRCPDHTPLFLTFQKQRE